MTTHLRQQMLSLPMPIPIQLFLCNTTPCLTPPGTFFCNPNEKITFLPSKEMRNNAYKISPWLYLFFWYFIMIYQNSWPLLPSAPKGKSKFEILLVRVFSLKQKNKSITSSYYRQKSFFLSSRKQPHPFRL